MKNYGSSSKEDVLGVKTSAINTAKAVDMASRWIEPNFIDHNEFEVHWECTDKRGVNVRFGLILSVCVAWAVCSLAPIWKYFSHLSAAVVTFSVLLSIFLGMCGLNRLNQRDRQINRRWFLLLFFVLTTAFVALYPVSLKYTLKNRSDREDALRVELVAVHQHKYPYDSRTFLGNPPTPLPGALLLAAPFFLIGHIAWQNFLWLGIFFYFAASFFRYRATALFFLVLFLLLSPSNLSDFISGGDYLTNFFYIAIAITYFVRSLDSAYYTSISAAAFLGLVLSSRGIYVVILVPLLILALQRISHSRVSILFLIILSVATTVTIPVFMPHPLANLLHQLSENPNKLRYISPALHPQLLLPLLGLAMSCVAIAMRMDLRRLFLLFSISSLVVLAPPITALTFHVGKLPYECSYLAISALSFALWALSRYEDRRIQSHSQSPQ